MLKKTLTDEFNAHQAQAQRKFEAERGAAERYDALVADLAPEVRDRLVLPRYVHSLGKFGISFGLPPLSIDELLVQLQVFLPINQVAYRRQGTFGFALTAPEGSTYTQPTDGVQLRFGHYTPCIVQWETAQLGTFRAELRLIHGITPEYRADVKRVQDIVTEVSNERLTWPEVPGAIPPALESTRYAKGAKENYAEIVAYGRVTEALVAWAAEATRRGKATWDAYIAYKQAPKAGIAGPTEDALVERYRTASSRSGTLEQFLSLESNAALWDQDVAKRFWPQYAKDHGIATTQDYFDYYAWACAWLERHGLFVVEHDGKPYKYGSAWL